ncbi:hypothetical protein DASC09_010070 [Saccharomycopsis crataegensis]|uniref:Uncharacterized protein n=1 Tax=Saccharomycopsis crataegensis TaxID=43959 RepID=A0AAV5QGD1_9ASCO|nr:hypothetical protein DASC09_010070 [Saccharomycopsis crataegensis]
MLLSKILQIKILTMLAQSYPLGSLEGQVALKNKGKTSPESPVSKNKASKNKSPAVIDAEKQNGATTASSNTSGKQNDETTNKGALLKSNDKTTNSGTSADSPTKANSDGQSPSSTSKSIKSKALSGAENAGELAVAGGAIAALADQFVSADSDFADIATSASAAVSSSACVPSAENLCPVDGGTYTDSENDTYNSLGSLISYASDTVSDTATDSAIATATTAI